MSDSVVKRGNHWGSVDADWVINKTDPPTSPPVPVAVSGPMDTTKPEVVPNAPKSTVSRSGDGKDSGTTDN